jgi:hypothetical protein
MKVPMLHLVEVPQIDASQRTIGELIRDRERSLLVILRLRVIILNRRPEDHILEQAGFPLQHGKGGGVLATALSRFRQPIVRMRLTRSSGQ